jgi:LysR family transcriptional regulator, glycine cleavage system transcriptional activator
MIAPSPRVDRGEPAMPNDIPPLNALRAFEAAGRHLSITKAADELCVTVAAVSHQVKTLEDYLEVRLFRRAGNSLFLTDAGQSFLPGLRAGFAELERAMGALREHDCRGPLVLSVAPIFATKWLIPRLDGFRAAQPDIDVRISATLELADFERDGIDAAVRVGRGRYPGLVSHRLFGESVVPMCSPALLKGAHALASPADLRHHVLLHFDWPAQEQVTPDWGTWLRSMGVTGIDATRGPRFAQPDYAMQAAVEGAGVVLGWRSLAQTDVGSGRLTIPFDLPLEMDVAFYLVYPEASAERRKLARFREWLLEQAVTSPGRRSPRRVPERTAKGRRHRRRRTNAGVARR